MKVEYVILADAAQVCEGKLFVLGGLFALLRCAAFPFDQSMAFATSLLLDPQETGKVHPVTLEFTDETGTPVLPPATLSIGAGSSEVPDADHRAVFVVSARVQIQKPGRYTLTVKAPPSAVGTASFNAILAGQQVQLLTPEAPAPLPPPALGRRKKTH